MKKTVILIDNRKRCGIPNILKEKGIPILFENLEIGDFDY
jgi:ERCC4-type nuclease